MKMVHMTAVGGPEVLKLVDVEEPRPGPGEIRVANQAIAINFHEINERRGQGETPALPAPMGSDFAGPIDAVGEGVEALKVGDRVVGMAMRGAYAEKTCTPAALAFPIPDGVTTEQAASCPVAGLTAYFLLHDNHVGPDTTVVAHAGAGSVGCFVAGLGKADRMHDHRAGEHRGEGGDRQEGRLHPRGGLPEGGSRRGDRATHRWRVAQTWCSTPSGARASSRATRCAGSTARSCCSATPPAIPPRKRCCRSWARGRTWACACTSCPRPCSRACPSSPRPIRRCSPDSRAATSTFRSTRMPLAEVREAHRRIEAQETVGKVILQP